MSCWPSSTHAGRPAPASSAAQVRRPHCPCLPCFAILCPCCDVTVVLLALQPTPADMRSQVRLGSRPSTVKCCLQRTFHRYTVTQVCSCIRHSWAVSPYAPSRCAGGYRYYAGLGQEEAKWRKQRFRTVEIRTAARLLRCLASGKASMLAGDLSAHGCGSLACVPSTQLRLVWSSANLRKLQQKHGPKPSTMSFERSL